MSDQKISGLPAATTPLAGTEVFPIVQSSTTKKVAVQDVLSAPTPIGSSTPNTVVGTTVFTSSDIENQKRSTRTPTTTGAVYDKWVNGGGNYFLGVDSSVGYRLLTAPYGFVMLAESNRPLLFGTNNAEVYRVTTSGIVPIANGGVDFSNNSTAAGKTSTLLNWYEEGTWTPSDQSGANLSFTVTNAKYTRIGNTVHAYLYISFPSTASTAIVKIGGLPFTVAANVLSPSVISTSVGTVAALRTIPGTTNMYLINPATNIDYTNANMSTLFVIATVTYFV